MELVDRYLNAVKKYLPRAQEADVVDELSDSIRSQMEEREAQLGRRLTLEEQSAIIKPYGPPVLAASRYQPPRNLVGPSLLPYYWQTLKIVLLVVYALEVAATILRALTGEPLTFANVWGLLWGTLVGTVGLVTLVFAVMEYFQNKSAFVSDWDPRSLPKSFSTHKISRAQSIFDLIFNLIFASWLLNIPGIRHMVAYLLIGPAVKYTHAGPFQVTDWWHILLPALLGLSAANVVVGCINLVKPDWIKVRAAIFLAESAFMLVVYSIIVKVRPFVVLSTSARHSADLVSAASVLNMLVLYSIVIGVLVCLVAIGVNLRQLIVPRPAKIIGPVTEDGARRS